MDNKIETKQCKRAMQVIPNGKASNLVKICQNGKRTLTGGGEGGGGDAARYQTSVLHKVHERILLFKWLERQRADLYIAYMNSNFR